MHAQLRLSCNIKGAVRLIIPASSSKDTDEAIKYYLKKAPARIAAQNVGLFYSYLSYYIRKYY